MKLLQLPCDTRQIAPRLVIHETKALARRNGNPTIVVRRAPVVALTVRERTAPAPIPQLPPPQTYAAERADGFVSSLFGASLNGGSAIEIELPFGTPRFTNAATLRQLLGGKPGDRLLRNTQNGTWEICEDSLRVDLLDQHVQFRVGPVAVYS